MQTKYPSHPRNWFVLFYSTPTYFVQFKKMTILTFSYFYGSINANCVAPKGGWDPFPFSLHHDLSPWISEIPCCPPFSIQSISYSLSNPWEG